MAHVTLERQVGAVDGESPERHFVGGEYTRHREGAANRWKKVSDRPRFLIQGHIHWRFDELRIPMIARMYSDLMPRSVPI